MALEAQTSGAECSAGHARSTGEGVQESGEKTTLALHRGAISSLKVVQDGDRELLISADGEGLIFVWETDTFTQLARLEGHKLGVASLAVYRGREGGYELFSGGYDSNIWQWCLTTMKVG